VLACCVVVVPVLGYYALQAGFGTLWFDLVVYPIKFLSSNEVNSPRTYLHQFPAVHSLADIVRFAAFLFVYLLVPYIYLLALYLLRRYRYETPAAIRQRLMLLNLMGLFLALAVASGPRFHRICMIAAPACIVFVWILARETPMLRVAHATVWVVAAAYAVWLPVHRQREAHATLPLPTGRLAVGDTGAAAELQWLADRTRPGDAVFNLAAPGLYLALDNPAPVDFLNDNDSTRPEQVSAALQAFRLQPPRFIALAPQNGQQSAQDHSGPFREFVHEHYRLARTFRLQNSWTQEIWELEPATK